jgi:hypothetical protein
VYINLGMTLRPGLFAPLVLACACSSGAAQRPAGSGDFPAEPLVSATSAGGQLNLEVRSQPQPPTRGMLTVELTIARASTSAPQDGLTLTVVPWMPAMGHGSSVLPTVTPGGNGKYIVSNLALFMPGQWELRTTIAGAMADSAMPTLDIP